MTKTSGIEPEIRYSEALGRHLVTHPNGKHGWWKVVCPFCDNQLAIDSANKLADLLKK